MIQIRSVTVRNVKYLRCEDVVEFIRDLASTEETDVRNRLEQMAYNLAELEKKSQCNTD